MLRISKKNMLASLMQCFQLLGGVVPAGSGDGLFGGDAADRRLSNQIDKALASRVLSFIDRELSPEQAAYYRWVYGVDEKAKDSWLLMNYAWSRVESEFEGRRIRVRDNLSSLRIFVPHEVRYQVLNDGEAQYSNAQLGEMVGVTEGPFRRNYYSLWCAMVYSLHDLQGDSEQVLMGFFDKITCVENSFKESA